EIADGDGVVGQAPGDVAVAAEVESGRADVERAGGVERWAGHLRLDPLARRGEEGVRVGAEDRRAGRRAGAAGRPVVAPLVERAPTVAVGMWPRALLRDDRLVGQLGAEEGLGEVGREEAPRRVGDDGQL